MDLSGAAFVEFTAGGDIRIDLPLGPMSTVATTWHFLGGERSPATGSILIRRQNLSSSGDVSEIQGTAKTVLAPGYWEVRARRLRVISSGRLIRVAAAEGESGPPPTGLKSMSHQTRPRPFASQSAQIP